MNEITTQAEMTKEQLALIKATIAKNATDDELKLFLYQAKRLQLDPLSKQIYFVKYGNNPGSVIIAIDGFRLVAHRTGKLSGIKRGAMFNDQGVLIGGWAEVYRNDWTHPAREEVPLSEYFKTGNKTWEQMPETMIKKVAEAAALRMAFPSDLSGVYESSEMPEPNQKHEAIKEDKIPEFPSPTTTRKELDFTFLSGPDKAKLASSFSDTVLIMKGKAWTAREKNGEILSTEEIDDRNMLRAYLATKP